METQQKVPGTQSTEYWLAVADIFSQAVTGELIGMANFASLTDIIQDTEEMIEAVEHAYSERGHAIGFLAMARKYELKVNINLQGTYWKGIRESFLRWAGKKDYAACILIQEIMLESFAVSMYQEVGQAMNGEIGELFLQISQEEESHLHHSIEFLRVALEQDPKGFEQKVYEVHQDCMTILSELAGKSDARGHCGVCYGDCVKHSLHHVGLDIVSLRGHALNLYMKSLDKIGIPGEKSLQWIASLPV